MGRIRFCAIFLAIAAAALGCSAHAAQGTIETVAGGGTGGDGGPATLAVLSSPGAVAAHPGGGFVFTEASSNRVRRVDGLGTVSSIAAVQFPYAVAVDQAGNVYISHCCEVLRVVPGGTATIYVSSVAQGLALDAAQNLYLADVAVIRKVNPSGTVTTAATLWLPNGAPVFPSGIAVDGSGNFFVTQSSTTDHYVHKVDATGVMTTIAGIGAPGFGGDGGPATLAQLNGPRGVAVDPDGNVYFSDRVNNRVRKVGTDGMMSTVAGNGVAGFSGDGGPATSAALNQPIGVAWDPAGFLLIVDSGNNRIRRVEMADVAPNDFEFPAEADAPLSSLVQSAAVTPSGFTARAAVSVSGGEYSIGCTGTFTSAASSSLDPGQAICVRHVSSAVNNKDTVTLLSIGSTQARFVSTTVAGPGSIGLAPVSIDFGGQSMNTTAVARTVTLTNTGATPAFVNAVTASAGFAATHDCDTLAPSATCTVNVTFTPNAADAFSGSLRLQNSPGTQLVPLAGLGERSLATHYYRAILRRAPDATGKQYWEDEALRLVAAGANPNETWIAMAYAFFFSTEYAGFNRDDAGFVTDLYRTFFNRDPDPSGASFWTQELAGGVPREVVLVSFAFSPEFAAFTRAVFGDTPARAEVDMVMDFYRGALSRLPEAAGLQSWVQRFRTAQCAGHGQVYQEADTISGQFLNSPEYLERARSNGQYVGDLYNAFMRRGGDPSGVLFWVGQLDTGARTRDQERASFIATPEFYARVQRIIAQGCLPPG